MRIKKITYQHRRDFDALFECEHCGHEEEIGGCYDDAYYHANVIPKFTCEKCGKTAAEDYRPLTTKYQEGVQV